MKKLCVVQLYAEKDYNKFHELLEYIKRTPVEITLLDSISEEHLKTNFYNSIIVAVSLKTQAEKLDELFLHVHDNTPIFLISNEAYSGENIIRIMERITESFNLTDDSVQFIGDRILNSITKDYKTSFPPLTRAVLDYNDIHEYSWAAPGHQGGVGFTKSKAGRQFYDFIGENSFRIDMGIERTTLGSLLDHTGAFKKSEELAAKTFGADISYSVLAGTSGSNRTILQACLAEGDIALCDRNCHKSIEQGLILTGALPEYLVPSRNAYGIIGPIDKAQLSRATLAAKLLKDYNTTDKLNYAVITNCTYDGLCYNSVEVEKLLSDTASRIHLDEAWYGYAKFHPIYKNHYAMRGDAKDYTKGPTIFATHSTHKLLNAFSQASYIHIRQGEKPINFTRFNQAYMMHASTSPLYAIAMSNDISASMMEQDGTRLIGEVISSAIKFRQSIYKFYKELHSRGEWFFKPWNNTVVKELDGSQVEFDEASSEALSTLQTNWVLHPGDSWHGFKDIDENWCMLDPTKVSILTPGLNTLGEFEEFGVSAILVAKYLTSLGIVPTRTTDFQLMFLFSMGTTDGKRETLLNSLLKFKQHFDANILVEELFPDLVQSYPEYYAGMSIQELNTKIFTYLKTHTPHKSLNAAYSTLPRINISPKAAYQEIVRDNVELVPLDELTHRTLACSLLPYPPGIPIIMSGEEFGENSPQVKYLKSLEIWDGLFPGFEYEVEGAEVRDGKYYALCIKQ